LAGVSTYLNFAGNTEEAFAFYKSVFGTEYLGPVNRMGEAPVPDGAPEPSDALKNMILHIALPITGGHIIHATDAPAEMGFTLVEGNNMYIMIEPDTREEADALFAALSAGSDKIEMEMAEQFWGDYFGSFIDKFGIGWMVNVAANR
jgi:PhnB protein